MELPQSSIVSCEWLKANQNLDDLIIIEAKLKPVKAADNWDTDFKIPAGVQMDVKTDFSDKNSVLPNTIQNEEDFTLAAQNLGINNNSTLVIYDQIGVYGSCRAWWLFKTMGHDKIFVLNGGLPEWQKLGFETEKKVWPNVSKGNFEGKLIKRRVKTAIEVLQSINSKETLIMDARSVGRFYGTAPEPRLGLRSGHIPNSVSLPYGKVLNGNILKSREELKALFTDLGADDENIIMSCGSGVTASVLALAAEVSGFENVSVYDGSWSEWGIPSDLPVSMEG